MKYFYAVFLLALLCTSGCSNDKAKASSVDPKPAPIEEATDANLVKTDHAEQFPLVRVETQKASAELSVNGVVTPDVSRTVPVNSLSGGRVVDIKVKLGDDVQRGQTLVSIHSPDVAQAFADYKKFVADEALARKSLERTQLLFSHGAIAQKEVQVAESAEEKAKVDAEAAAERIRILGARLDQPSPIIAIAAPVSGTIIEQNTAGGAGVKSLDNSPNLFTIADLSRIWIVCDVYENNLSQVHIGDQAEIRLNAYADRVLKGQVSNISKLLDPNTRTAKVRIDLDNRGGLMRQGMFATVRFVSQGKQTRMVLPTTALLRLQDKDWVFVKQDAKQFRRTEVHAGPSAGEAVQQVLTGLKPGDQVVKNALQFSRAMEQD